MKSEAPAGCDALPNKVQRFESVGDSMLPTLQCGDELLVLPDAPCYLGDIVLYYQQNRWIAHRVVVKFFDHFITKGDSGRYFDSPIKSGDIWGKVMAFERQGRETSLTTWQARLRGFFLSLTSFRGFPFRLRRGYRMRVGNFIMNQGRRGNE